MPRAKTLPIPITVNVPPDKWGVLNSVAKLYNLDLHANIQSELQVILDKMIEVRIKTIQAVSTVKQGD